MRRKVGFTLKEVLVVIVTLMVLMAIVLPSLNGARRTAQRAQCLANLRQLGYSFVAYAGENNGYPISTYSSTGDFWATQLMGYSSKIDTQKGILLSALCPCALTPSNLAKGVGTATMAWGPSNTSNGVDTAPFVAGESYGPLVVGNQYGSYGINGQVYRDNHEAVGVMARTVDTSGNHSVYGNVITTGNINLQGNAQITGNVITGGIVTGKTGNIGGTIAQNVPNLVLPDVVGFYNMLALSSDLLVMSSIPNNANLDFNANSVIQVTGDADLSNIKTITGSGTLIVAGNVTSLMNGLSVSIMHVVTLGTSNVKNGYLNGSLYSVGDATGNGNGRINGNLITLGAYSGNGGPDVYPAATPWWDNTSGRVGYLKAINTNIDDTSAVPLFGDCIWAEAWPTGNEPPPSSPKSTATGDINGQLNRYYINRHSNAINIVFLDCHAETVPLKKLNTLKWSH